MKNLIPTKDMHKPENGRNVRNCNQEVTRIKRRMRANVMQMPKEGIYELKITQALWYCALSS